jgi:hypothetical protein
MVGFGDRVFPTFFELHMVVSKRFIVKRGESA